MRVARPRERKQLKAVHESDLEALLESLGVLRAIRAGHRTCDICGDQVTLDNLEAIFPMEGRVGLGCDKRSCLEKAVAFGTEIE